MGALDSELAALPTLSAHQLRLKWQDLRCGEPTAAASRDLMIREIAYKMQERAHGLILKTNDERNSCSGKLVMVNYECQTSHGL